MNWRLFWAGFVFFAFAAAAGFGWFYFSRQGAKMRKYISAEGTVLSAKMPCYWKSSRDSNGRSRKNLYYEPIMEYTYTVGGRKYTSASVIFGGGEYASTSRGEIEKIVDHPAGGPIPVFYNPDKPAESFLDKKASSDVSFVVGCAAFTILFGAIGIFAMVAGVMGVTGNNIS